MVLTAGTISTNDMPDLQQGVVMSDREAINNLTAAIDRLAEVMRNSLVIRSYPSGTVRRGMSIQSANKQVQELVKTLLQDGPQPSNVIEAAIKTVGIRC